MVPWTLVAGALGGCLVAWEVSWARIPLVGGWVAVAGAAALGWFRPQGPLPRVIAAPSYAAWAVVAGLHAWINVLRGDLTPTWEPTRRDLEEALLP
jgi:hypothetical protein